MLHEQYAQPIFNYCLRRLRSREEAEDAAQIVFLNAHRGLEEGVEPQSERAWLFKIAERVVMYRRRTISRRARVEFPVDVDALADLVVAPEHEAVELRDLPDALARLPTAQQRAIVLREWYGLSYREIAAELGLSVSATETLIFRARCRLAQELGGPAPTVRRRTPLSLASPLASLKWLLGGGTAVKALVGVTSVAVLAVGSASVGLLPHPGSPRVAPVVPRALVLATVPASQQFVPARRRASAPVAAAGRLVVAEDPAPVAETPARAPVPEQADPPQEAAPVASVVPPVAEPVGAVTASAVDPAIAPVANAPAPTPDPGQTGDVHGPNEHAAAGQAQRSENVPPNAADPGSQGHGNGSNGGNNGGNPPPAHEPGPPRGQGDDAVELGAAVAV